MDVNMINPILSAFAQVIPQIGFSSIEKKGISLSKSTLNNDGVLISISMVGPLRGSILIGMKLDSATQFASKMMMGMPVLELDELAKSALCEMGNMVCANACTLYSNAGVVGLDISPPTLISGNGEAMLSVPQIIVVSFDVDGIDVDMYVGLMD